MKSHIHRDYGMKHLIVKPSSKTDHHIDFSRIRPPTRIGVASNHKWLTFVFLVQVHGPRFPLKRGRHLIHRERSVSLLDTLTVWRDIGLLIFPRTDSSLSVVSNSRKVSRMHLSGRMQTPSFFHLSEMMSMHMPTHLQMRVLIHRTQMIQIQS